MRFAFGTDPEFILCDSYGRPKSAIGVIGRGRGNRLESEGNFFFYDNVLAECTVKPAFTAEEAVENVGISLKSMSQIVAPYKITDKATAEFDDSEMGHKEARESGCSPEFCAYGMKEVSNSKIKKLFKNSNVRTAGGHVHIGFDAGDDCEACLMAVRMLDLFLGVPSIVMDYRPGSRRRRRLYGSAGRYRQPDHGLEYRTLGNFWLSSPHLVRLVFDICSEVVRLVEEGFHESLWSVNRDLLESDDFWNAGGSPSDCHVCHGYDVNTLKGMFHMGRNEALRSGADIVSLVCRNMRPSIKSRILQFARKDFDIYKEWDLN